MLHPARATVMLKFPSTKVTKNQLGGVKEHSAGPKGGSERCIRFQWTLIGWTCRSSMVSREESQGLNPSAVPWPLTQERFIWLKETSRAVALRLVNSAKSSFFIHPLPPPPPPPTLSLIPIIPPIAQWIFTIARTFAGTYLFERLWTLRAESPYFLLCPKHLAHKYSGALT